jgi:protein gp37
MNERMFPFITQTWNPLGGSCEHDCEYCWVPILKHKFPFVNLKYGGPSKLYTKELAKVKQFAASDFVFVCDCTDLFGSWVPKEYIQLILDAVETSPAQFLLLTKNPIRYQEFKLPNNCVAGVTIETSLENNLQNAPKREDRWLAMVNLKHHER